MLLYYNQILGLEALYVSVALALAVIFDAVSDPLVAAFSDNIRSRWGRRHPLMFIASIPLGIGVYCVFMPPEGLSDAYLFAWLLCFTVLTRSLMTLYFVPWAAIAAELSDDYAERTSVMSYRFAVGWFIGVGFPIFIYTFVMTKSEAYPVGQLNPDAYPTLALYLSLIHI